MANEVITNTPADQVFEPTSNSPCHWPEKVMGHDLCGSTMTVPPGVDYDREPGIQNSSKDVNDGKS